MTLLWSLLSLGLAGGAAFLFGFGSVLPDEDHLRRKRLGLERIPAETRSPLIRTIHPLIWAFKPLARRVYTQGTYASVERRLLCAGMEGEVSVEEFLAYKLALPVALFALWFALAGGQGLLQGLAAGLSYLFPDLWLNGRRRTRQRAILERLPFTIDLVTLSVEAGLDFGQALSEVSTKLGGGALADEIQKTLKQIRLGATRLQALTELASRVGLPEVGSLVAVLVQADRLGVGIGKALRAQSDQLRSQRFHRAEEMGAAAAQKILIPLVLFALPAVVLLIFGAVGLAFVGG